MNCRQFQHEMDEYLDGTLSPTAQAAAEEHLAGCAPCRLRLEQERQVTQALTERFRHATGSLQLPGEVGQRVLAALADERFTPEVGQAALFWWRRLAWPLAAAASALLLLAGWFFLLRVPGPRTVHPQPHLAGGGISAQLSYVIPTYTFRQEGEFVVDALTYQTNVVNERLQPQLARLK